jgi:hypothetical protein
MTFYNEYNFYQIANLSKPYVIDNNHIINTYIVFNFNQLLNIMHIFIKCIIYICEYMYHLLEYSEAKTLT